MSSHRLFSAFSFVMFSLKTFSVNVPPQAAPLEFGITINSKTVTNRSASWTFVKNIQMLLLTDNIFHNLFFSFSSFINELSHHFFKIIARTVFIVLSFNLFPDLSQTVQTGVTGSNTAIGLNTKVVVYISIKSSLCLPKRKHFK